MSAPAALVQRLTDDFAVLQNAVLERMNTTAGGATLSALAHPSLLEPIAVALAHAQTLARGKLRVAVLGRGPTETRR